MIHEQLANLPAKYRIVLVLRHLQDMTYEEMAEILTMPIGTIKTHLFRARNLLKNVWKCLIGRGRPGQRVIMRCPEAHSQLQDYIDNRLSMYQVRELERHIAQCAPVNGSSIYWRKSPRSARTSARC